MAQLIFSEIGARIGGAVFTDGFLGLSGAQIGGAIGAVAGGAVYMALAGPIAEGPRLAGLSVMESREGAGIPRVYGRYRIGSQLIWATNMKERKSSHSAGGKGGPRVTEYNYTISFAVGLCEGEIIGVDQVWANGELFSLYGVNWRLYRGGEDQLPDPLMVAVEGSAPAYRGLAYIVFEDFPLDDFGARLPQLSFEVMRPVLTDTGLKDKVTGVNFIPASGEWVYSPSLVRKIEYPGWETVLNSNSSSGEVDVVRALDQMQAELPNVSSVNLTLAWFGDDLRAGSCEIRPGIETQDQLNLPDGWRVAGQSRETARLISRDENDRPYYGGTPDDASVLELLDEMVSRGLSVTLSPFLLMDIPPGNGKPDPYGGAEQAAFPWRGRIISAGDKTASARSDLDAFFGTANAADFGLNGTKVTYSGPSEWSYRRFVLHLAMLGKASGQLSGFLLGSELRGLTRLRDQNGSWPGIEHLVSLAAEVRVILGAEVQISYAADWTEYGAYVPDDGSGDVLFPLDGLWGDTNLDYVGIDWYAPLSDWRDGAHLDGALYDDIHDPAYLAANIEGGEGYDWYYASDADRDAQIRTPISDTAHGEDWIFRSKDLRGWWETAHFERPSGVRGAVSTGWTAQSKPIRLIEIGCGAVDKGSNAPNVFVDPKSSESGLPPYSDGSRDDGIQAASIEALYDYWSVGGGNNPVSSVYGGPMIPADGLAVWAYDARPFPAFPVRTDIWADGENWAHGHWLNGRLSVSPLGAIIETACEAAGISCDVKNVSGSVPGYMQSGFTTLSEFLSPLAVAFSLTCRQSEDGLVFSNALDASQALSIGAEDFALSEQSKASERYIRKVTEHGPKGVRLTLPDPENAYQPASVHIGEGVDGDRDVEVSLPFAFAADDAQDLAEIFFAQTNADRASSRLYVSPHRADIGVGDLVSLPGAQDLLQVWSIEKRGLYELELKPLPEVFTGNAAPIDGGASVSHIPRPDAVILDLPGLPGSEDDIRPLIAGFAYPWPGGLSVSAGASATSQTARAVLTEAADIGALIAPLAPGEGDRMRTGTSIDVRFPAADFSSVTRTVMLNGANLLAIETGGGWMLAGFEQAEMLSGDSWRLSSLLTGIAGTEDLAALGADEGARVVVLNTALQRGDLSDFELGQSLIWSVFAAGGESLSVTQTLQGRALKPLRPGHLRVEGAPGSDMQVSWTRRARHSADRWDTPDVPLLEDELLFRVEISQNGSLLRSVETSHSDWLYTIANQSEDGLLSSTFQISVVQVSPGYGDGVAAMMVV